MSWLEHIDNIAKKCNSGNFALSRTKNLLPQLARKNIYNSLIKFHLEFGSLIYGTAKTSHLNKIRALQKRAVRNTSLTNKHSHTAPLFYSLQQLTLDDIIKYNRLVFMHGLRYQYLPASFNNVLKLKTDSACEENTDSISVETLVLQTRQDYCNFIIPPNKTKISFPRIEAAREWNAIPPYY